MSGTIDGGKKAAAANKARYGENYYSIIARKGGRASSGPFGTVPGLAERAGKLGGKVSSRSRQERTVQETNSSEETS